jgi:hypothetical protein
MLVKDIEYEKKNNHCRVTRQFRTITLLTTDAVTGVAGRRLRTLARHCQRTFGTSIHMNTAVKKGIQSSCGADVMSSASPIIASHRFSTQDVK